MMTKIALKILALACALLMVVSCITPCIAVNNSTNNISNADVTLEGASYIIVHVLNPEAIEIASIDGMSPYRVEIYDGDALIGYSAHNNETYNKPIAISPGTHTIKVEFNGMTFEQNVNLELGETKVITFTFERTEFYLADYIDSIGGSYTVSISREFTVSHSEKWWDMEISPYYGVWNAHVAGHMETGYGCEDVTGKVEASISVSFSSKEFYADGYARSQLITDCHWWIISMCCLDTYVIISPNIPAYDNFRDWYVQYFISGNYPEFREDVSAYATVFIDPDYDGYRVKKVPCSRTYENLRVSRFCPATGYGYGHYHLGGHSVLCGADAKRPTTESSCSVSPIEGSLQGLRFSSVPYDLTGTGIICEEVQLPVVSFTYSPENPEVNEEITFDASSSYDPDGEIVSYNWNFGDGNSTEGEVVTYAYSKAGNYTVTLRVTDNDGLQDATSEVVEVVSRKLNESTAYTISSTAPGYGISSISSPYYEYIGCVHSDPGAPPAGATGHGVVYGIDENSRVFIRVDVQVTTGNPDHYGNGEYVNAWIDWNGNKIYEADEQVMNQRKLAKDAYPIPYDGKLIYSELVDIPYSTARNTWMRVELGYGHSPDAVDSWTWGDVEDYEIEIPFGVTKEGQKEHAKNARNAMVEFNNGVECFDFATYQMSTILIISSAAAAILSGGSLTPAFIATLGLAVETETVAYLKLLNVMTIGAYDDIIKDPPDMNYTEVAELEPFEIRPPMGNSSFDIALANTFNNLSEQQAILKALLTSIERYDGALQEHESKYMLLQANAVKNYSDMLVSNLKKSNQSLGELSSATKLIESDANISADLATMQQRLSTQGFTEYEIQYFRDMGANDTEIEAYKQMLLDINLSDFSSVIEELRSVFNDGIVIYTNLSAQALDIIETLESALPDLTLSPSDIFFSSDTPLPGENVTINATIHNIGEADASNASILFYDGEPENGELIAEDIIHVSAGQTANASISWNTTVGNHEIYVLISPFNGFLEENYTNNKASKIINLTQISDSYASFSLDKNFGIWTENDSITSGTYDSSLSLTMSY